MNRIKSLIATMFNAEKKNKENDYILSGIHFTTNHTGKMAGMHSLSTSCKTNYHCVERSKIENSICHECYAITMSNNYSGLDKCLVRNTEILTGSIIDFEKLPFINAHSFRFESFGDLNNAIQAINYFNICTKNPYVNFAIWTKNPVYINEAIKIHGYKKPENLVIIYSSPMINNPVKLEKIKKIFPFIDKVFTVYKSEQAAKEHNATINCGSKNCIECLACYRHNNVTVISELLK